MLGRFCSDFDPGKFLRVLNPGLLVLRVSPVQFDPQRNDLVDRPHHLHVGLQWVFRSIVTGRFGIVTAGFGNVTAGFGNVTRSFLKLV